MWMAMAGRLPKKRLQQVCDELAKGRSLRSICDNDEAMPAWSTVLQSVQRDEASYEMYARARAIGAEVLADHMHDLASSSLPADLDPRFANAEVQRRRLEVDTLKWTFARMQPRGVRHKKEDVEPGAGAITLLWGGDTPADEPRRTPADVVQLVKSDGEGGTA
jgi:hypothetical protein